VVVIFVLWVYFWQGASERNHVLVALHPILEKGKFFDDFFLELCDGLGHSDLF